MSRTLALHEPKRIVKEVLDNGHAVVDLEQHAGRATLALERFDAYLRANADPAELDRKTMFPTKLANAPDSERRALQFHALPRKDAPATTTEFTALATPVSIVMHHMARTILEACFDMGLLDADATRQLQRADEWVLNALHYPGLPGKDGTVRFPAHRDWGTLALYPAIDGLGLQLQVDGGWVTYEPAPGTMLVYMGMIPHKLSGGSIPALSHRVVQMSERGRSALIYYADAARDIGLPDGRTVGEYIDGNLRKIGQIK